jgi:hypothetical protein
MRFVVLTFVLLVSCAGAAFAQCGPNHLATCQPSKVPDAGMFGANYSTCTAKISEGGNCWMSRDSVYEYPGGGTYVVPYCAPVRQSASCWCVQGQGLVETSGICTFKEE